MTRSLARSSAALAIVLAACAGPVVQPSPTLTEVTATEPAPVTTTTALPVEVVVGGFRACLAERGVEIEEIPLDAQGRPRLDLVLAGVDFSDPANLDALAACRDRLVGGVLDLSDSPELRQEVVALLETFASCVRDRGVEAFPDPVTGYAGVGAPFPPDSIPYEDPDLSAAVEQCRTRLIRPVP